MKGDSFVFEKVRTVAKEVLGIDLDSIGMDTCLSDIPVDSLDAVELFMALEDVFEVEIPEDFSPETVRDIVEFIDTCKTADDDEAYE